MFIYIYLSKKCHLNGWMIFLIKLLRYFFGVVYNLPEIFAFYLHDVNHYNLPEYLHWNNSTNTANTIKWQLNRTIKWNNQTLEHLHVVINWCSNAKVLCESKLFCIRFGQNDRFKTITHTHTLLISLIFVIHSKWMMWMKM